MLFGAINTSQSGLTANRIWMDAISDNIANINTERPTSGPAFQERFIQVQAVGQGGAGESGGAGVAVVGAQLGSAEGRLVSKPGDPMADAEGYVRLPDVDLGDQMTNLMMAQRGYQANLAVVERATNAYQAALGLGK